MLRLTLFCYVAFIVSSKTSSQDVNSTQLIPPHVPLNVTVCPDPQPPGPANPQDLAEHTLRHVFAIFRHGIRYPLGPSSTWAPNISRPSVGKLTKTGKKQMFDVGRILRRRYSEFLSEYDEDKVTVTSTTSRRAIMSALSLMAGLFPPSTNIFPDLGWQPVPVETSTDMDKSYIYINPNFPWSGQKICPALIKLLEKGWQMNNSPDLRLEHKQLYEVLQTNTGDLNLTSIVKVLIFFDDIHSKCLNRETPAAWLLEPRSLFQHKPLYPDVMRPIAYEWFKNVQYLENNKDMLTYMTGPLFNSIRVKFDGVLYKNSLRRMSVHMTHDIILSPLVWHLDPTEAIYCEPGDGVLFELHQTANSTTVKVFYYDANRGHTLKQLELSNCSSPCSYEEFTRKFESLTPEQWAEKCKL